MIRRFFFCAARYENSPFLQHPGTYAKDARVGAPLGVCFEPRDVNPLKHQVFLFQRRKKRAFLEIFWIPKFGLGQHDPICCGQVGQETTIPLTSTMTILRVTGSLVPFDAQLSVPHLRRHLNGSTKKQGPKWMKWWFLENGPSYRSCSFWIIFLLENYLCVRSLVCQSYAEWTTGSVSLPEQNLIRFSNRGSAQTLWKSNMLNNYAFVVLVVV